jgi:GTP:adenosylcobinamide-phosphate guanylyltransferase
MEDLEMSLKKLGSPFLISIIYLTNLVEAVVVVIAEEMLMAMMDIFTVEMAVKRKQTVQKESFWPKI